MGKHRSRLRILANILSVVSENNGAKKTQIMYQAYLSYSLLIQYLNDVTDAGLVTCGIKNFYSLTSKGKEFLAKFTEYDKSRANVDKQLSNIKSQRMMLEQMCPTTEITNDDHAHLEKSVGVQNE